MADSSRKKLRRPSEAHRITVSGRQAPFDRPSLASHDFAANSPALRTNPGDDVPPVALHTAGAGAPLLLCSAGAVQRGI
jgi:hypothetical protein